MLSLKKLLSGVSVVSCLVLAMSYFLPAAGVWAPVDAWRGYYSGGEFITGFNLGLVEVFPFGAGAIVLLTLALYKRPKVGFITMVIYAALWVVSLVCELVRIAAGGAYSFGNLWLITGVVIIPGVVVVTIMCLRKSQATIAVLTMTAALACSSILQQSCSIAWYLIEDKLLLNIGSVMGLSAAATLFVSRLYVRVLGQNE